MGKTLLMYETAVPVSPARHSFHSVEVGADYGFSASLNAVPLMAAEVLPAAAEYAVVFTEVGDEVMPVVVLGMQGRRNLYVAPDGRWMANYIPAFIRRYPFVFASSEDQQTLTLCIDETYPGVNTEGRGERLYGSDSKPTAFVDGVLRFLKEYQAQDQRTQAFGRRLREFGLLERMEAKVTTPDGEVLSLNGFTAVSRERLRAVTAVQLEQMVKSDELELIYMHLYSLRNFTELRDRLVGATGAEIRSGSATA